VIVDCRPDSPFFAFGNQDNFENEWECGLQKKYTGWKIARRDGLFRNNYYKSFSYIETLAPAVTSTSMPFWYTISYSDTFKLTAE